MELKDLREKIDDIDAKLLELFEQRMSTASCIGEYKKQHNLPVYDPAREREKLLSITENASPEMADYTEPLYNLIFEMSRSHQRKTMRTENELVKKIESAINKTEHLLPPHPLIACQGEEGSFSQQAANKLFDCPGIMYFNSFEGVFSAIDQGLCRYGVLPLENSTAGSVNKIYDLMMSYDFSIVKSTRVKVDQCLLAAKGAKLSDIKEIYSHQQAIAQCQDFLQSLKDVKVIPCENTAAAAKLVADSGRKDIASLSSRSCAEIYGLNCLKDSVQNHGNNYTRFICISKNLEIYPGADKTSIMMVLPHKPGALYRVLSCFYALGVNLIKLESRPLPSSDFEFMFYFDLEVSVYSDAFLRIFDNLEGLYSMMKYLGSYTEAV
jgi:chorismate mutase/prephenate dehydratase